MSVQIEDVNSSNPILPENVARLGLLSDIQGNSVIQGDVITQDSFVVPNTNISTEKGTSWYCAVLIVVNAALGAGLLHFPAAYHAAGGVVVALVIQAILMVFIIGALLILAFCSDVQHSSTYQDVVLVMNGKFAQTMCSVTLLLYCFGTCVTFFIIIGDQWDKFLSYVYGDSFCDKWYMDRRWTMASSSTVLILPLCFPKKIDFLKYASAVGVLGVLYVAVFVSVKYYIGPIYPGTIKTSPDTWMDVFVVVPVICFGYQCHVSVVPVYSCFAKRTVSEFSKTIAVSMSVCVLTYTVTAIFGYWTFGSKINSDILVSYKADTLVLIAVMMIAAKTYTTYPILLFCGRAALDSVWLDLSSTCSTTISSSEKTRRIVQTLVWFVTSLLLAIVIPNIGDVISVLGSLAAVFIFTFPGLCLLQLLLQKRINPQTHGIKYHLLCIVTLLYLVLGSFIFGVTVTQALWNDIDNRTIMRQSICDN